MIEKKLYHGSYPNKEYADCAVWCNQHGVTLEDRGDHYEVIEVSEFSSEKKQKLEMETRLTELHTYLDSTDWYCARYIDAGVEIPVEVKEQRQMAREEIDELRERLTLLEQKL